MSELKKFKLYGRRFRIVHCCGRRAPPYPDLLISKS